MTDHIDLMDLIRLFERDLPKREQEEIRNHLKACQSCRQKYDILKESDLFLKALHKFDPEFFCPEAERLFLFYMDQGDTEEKAVLEAHLRSCRQCREILAEFHRQEPDDIEMPSKDQWEPLPEKLRARIDISQKDRIISFPMPEAQQEPLAEQISEETDRVDNEVYYRALAAAPEEVDYTAAGMVGKAFGVAVSKRPEEGGEIVEVEAWVGKEAQEESKPTVVGVQLETGKTTPPLTFLEKSLLQLFQTVSILSELRLVNRNVQVKIRVKDRQYLEEAQSLTLPVVVAIVKAAAGKTAHDMNVYSGDIGFEGEILGVGQLKNKVKTVLAVENRRLVGPMPNESDIRRYAKETEQYRIECFPSITEIFHKFYGITDVSGLDDSAGTLEVAPSLTRRRYLPVFFVMTVMTLIYYGISRLAENLFFPAHFLLALHLKYQATHIFEIGQFLKFFGATVIAAVFSAALSAWYKDSESSWRRVFVEKSGPISIIMTIIFIVTLLSVYVGLLFVKTDRFERYQTVEYLKFRPIFSSLFDNMPNMRYNEFQKRVGEKKWKAALEVGVGIRPEEQEFQEVFFKMVNIIADRVNNAAFAGKLFSNYKVFIDGPGQKRLRLDVEDTTNAAELLVLKYYGQNSNEYRFIKKTRKDYLVPLRE